MLWLILLFLFNTTVIGDLPVIIQTALLILTLFAPCLLLLFSNILCEARQGWRKAFESIQIPLEDLIQYSKNRNSIVKEQKEYISDLHQILRHFLDRARSLEHTVDDRNIEVVRLNTAVEERDAINAGLRIAHDEQERFIAALPKDEQEVLETIRKNSELKALNISKDAELESLRMIQKERDHFQQLNENLEVSLERELQEKRVQQMDVISLIREKSMLEVEKADCQSHRDTLGHEKKELIAVHAAEREVDQQTIRILQAEKDQADERHREIAKKLSRSTTAETSISVKLRKLEWKVAELHNTITEHQHEEQRLRGKIRDLMQLEADNKDFCDKLETKTRALREVTKSNKHLFNSTDSLRSKIKDQKRDCEKHQMSLQRKTKQLADFQTAATLRIDLWRSDYDRLEEHHQKKLEELFVEKTRSENCYNEAQQARSSNQKLQRENGKLRIDKEQLQQTIDATEEGHAAIVEALEKENRELRAGTKEDKGKIACLERKVISANAEKTSHRHKLDSLRNKIKQLEDKYESAKAEAKSSHAEIDLLKPEHFLVEANAGSRTQASRLTEETQRQGRILQRLLLKLESKEKIRRRALFNIIEDKDDELPSANGTKLGRSHRVPPEDDAKRPSCENGDPGIKAKDNQDGAEGSKAASRFIEAASSSDRTPPNRDIADKQPTKAPSEKKLALRTDAQKKPEAVDKPNPAAAATVTPEPRKAPKAPVAKVQETTAALNVLPSALVQAASVTSSNDVRSSMQQKAPQTDVLPGLNISDPPLTKPAMTSVHPARNLEASVDHSILAATSVVEDMEIDDLPGLQNLPAQAVLMQQPFAHISDAPASSLQLTAPEHTDAGDLMTGIEHSPPPAEVDYIADPDISMNWEDWDKAMEEWEDSDEDQDMATEGDILEVPNNSMCLDPPALSQPQSNSPSSIQQSTADLAPIVTPPSTMSSSHIRPALSGSELALSTTAGIFPDAASLPHAEGSQLQGSTDAQRILAARETPSSSAELPVQSISPFNTHEHSSRPSSNSEAATSNEPLPGLNIYKNRMDSLNFTEVSTASPASPSASGVPLAPPPSPLLTEIEQPPQDANARSPPSAASATFRDGCATTEGGYRGILPEVTVSPTASRTDARGLDDLQGATSVLTTQISSAARDSSDNPAIKADPQAQATTGQSLQPFIHPLASLHRKWAAKLGPREEHTANSSPLERSSKPTDDQPETGSYDDQERAEKSLASQLYKLSSFSSASNGSEPSANAADSASLAHSKPSASPTSSERAGKNEEPSDSMSALYIYIPPQRC